MFVHKFFYLTIQGDDLDLSEMQRAIHLPCEVFRKGEIIARKVRNKAFLHTPQKTNRWLYTAEDTSEMSPEKFLLDQLDFLIAHITDLQNYIEQKIVKMELVLYADNETYFEFSKEHIIRLNQLGLGVELSFC